MVTNTVRLRAVRRKRRNLGRLTSSHNRLWAYNFELRLEQKPSSALGYLITANFRTLRVFPLQVLASSCLPQQILKFSLKLFAHFDEPKNSLELPNLTRSIRKCLNKLMNNTSDEIDLQSK